MKQVIVLSILVPLLAACANSSRVASTQPVRPVIDQTMNAPVGAVEGSPLAPPGGGGPAPAGGAKAVNDPYVWARVDGQRMAGNPELTKQGQDDRAACYAASGNASDLNAYAKCMQGRGYTRLMD